MEGVVLAAGKGTRLRPLTLTRTKAMAPVVGKPLVRRVVDTLAANDVRDLVFVVSPEDDAIRNYFGDGAWMGIRARYVEQSERLGMAHALGLAAPHLSGPFVMSACDNLVAETHVGALIATHFLHRAAATLSLMAIDIAMAGSTGIVVWDSPHVRRIVEKPRPENAPSNISSLPLYVFSPELLELLPRVRPSARGEYEVQDAIQMLIDESATVTGVLTESRRQVTSAADLLSLNLEYLIREPGQQVVATATVPASVTIIPPVVVEGDVTLGANATVGPRVYLERNVHVGECAELSDTMVLSGASVPPGAKLTRCLVAPDLPVTNGAPARV